MKRGRLLLGGVVLLLVAGALVFYFAFVPGMQADDYKKAARPEHAKLVKAMERVDRTFSFRTFGASRKIKAKSPEEYVRELRKFVAGERREIKPASTAIKKARSVLKDVNEGALLDVPSWPVIGGSGDLGKAEDLADDERAYLEASRRFLPRYARLVEYASDEIEFADQTGLAMGNGVAALPEHPTSPEQVARPMDSVAAKIERITRDYRRIKPPKDVRRTVHEALGLAQFLSRTFREFADAVRARDLAKINQFDETLSKGVDRYELGSKSVRRLVTKSSYSRELRRIRKLNQRVEKGYAGF
jgi:hypothetical protein